MDGVADGRFNARLKGMQRHPGTGPLFFNQISSVEAWTKASFSPGKVMSQVWVELPAGTGTQSLRAGQQLP